MGQRVTRFAEQGSPELRAPDCGLLGSTWEASAPRPRCRRSPRAPTMPTWWAPDRPVQQWRSRRRGRLKQSKIHLGPRPPGLARDHHQRTYVYALEQVGDVLIVHPDVAVRREAGQSTLAGWCRGRRIRRRKGESRKAHWVVRRAPRDHVGQISRLSSRTSSEEACAALRHPHLLPPISSAIGGQGKMTRQLASTSSPTPLFPVLTWYFDDSAEIPDEVIDRAYVTSDELTRYEGILEHISKTAPSILAERSSRPSKLAGPRPTF